MIKFNQRYFLATKEFILLEDKILVKEKSLFDEKEWEARFDELGFDLVKYKSREGIGSVIVFSVLSILSFILAFKAFSEEGTDIKLAFMFLFLSLMWITFLGWSFQKYFLSLYILNGGSKNISFFINSPSEIESLGFIEKVRDKVISNLKKELATFDPDLAFEEQLNNLKYLKTIGALDLQEFEKLREHFRHQHILHG